MNRYGKTSDPAETLSKSVTLIIGQSRVNGTIDLVVDIGRSVETVRFHVVERLATQVILGCSYCDKPIESIRPRQQMVELANGTIVPIVRKPSPRDKVSNPLEEEQ